MDPDKALSNAREALAIYRKAEDELCGDYDAAAAAEVLADSFEALDGWLSKGGFKPAAWKATGDLPTKTATTIPVRLIRGWGWPGFSKKAHYFIDGRSLCGKWMYLGELEDSNHESSDNCATCKTRHARMQPKEKT